MRYTPIPSNFFIQNRARLAARLAPKSVAIVTSNALYPTNADATFPFKQNTDLFYLSGIDQERSTLVLFPEAPRPEWRETLFIPETNEHIRIWEGEKLSKQQAQERSGISKVYWAHEFDTMLHQIIFEAENIYIATNEHLRADAEMPTATDVLLQKLRAKYPLHTYKRLSPLLADLRMIKSETEIQLLSKAIAITKEAFLRILSVVRPGLLEYQIEAEITHTFLWHGANGHAYAPIIASGANTCVLHYTANDKPLQDGDLLLLDFGATYAHYNADLTRTIPVNGTFTPRQKAVYKAVLHIQRQAIKLLTPNQTLTEYTQAMADTINEQLCSLGLLTEKQIQAHTHDAPAYKKYFMHGLSHHLGLDVHDVYHRFTPLAPGMVLTCEPGIYIPDEKIGIRLENNILVQQHTPVDLMAHIPIEPDEIEYYMQSGK